jgi:hypothetical protein
MYNLFCQDDERRQAIINHPTLNGIEAIEVTATTLETQRFVRVYFLNTNGLNDLVGQTSLVAVAGGVRITDLRVLGVTRVDDHIVVEVDRAGDFSPYTLTILTAWIDPVYRQKSFGFKVGCPSDFDCKDDEDCPEELVAPPLIDYMAKDYASFRGALLDWISLRYPDWTERNPADLGMVLVELLAYAGDQLSYYQDAIANEAYLETARQRISVRRHARLVDYAMHDGASARTWMEFRVESAGIIPPHTPLLSQITQPIGVGIPGTVIPLFEQAVAEGNAGITFETMHPAPVHPLLNEIGLYDWGNRQCCLPKGATSVDLVGDLTTQLGLGDYLLFEEVRGVVTGLAADADPEHRQVVRLTTVELTSDPLNSQVLTRVAWDRADALEFALCLSALTTGVEGGYVAGISVARGNLVLADHGQTIVGEAHEGSVAPAHEEQRRAFRFLLNEAPLSFQHTLPHDNGVLAPAVRLLDTDPHTAQPQVRQLEVTGTLPDDDWQPVPHLLDSDEFAHHFAVETDNSGRALLRFGDGMYGERVPDNAGISVTYRVGVGRAGNIGREALAHIIHMGTVDFPDILAGGVRNCMPAWGGVDPEPIAKVKQDAPAAFHHDQRRAVTETDYANVATRHPEVAKAVATFRWTGSWHTVFITIDPEGRTDVDNDLQGRVKDWVTRFTQAGYDLEIDPPIYVPLEIEINVCVTPTHFRAHVKEAVLMALSNQVLGINKLGFFHPDHFTFGQSLYLSQLYAAVESVAGVDSADVTKFQRYGKPANQELAKGFISMGRLEVARLDNDANFPEHGVLRVVVLGGK